MGVATALACPRPGHQQHQPRLAFGSAPRRKADRSVVRGGPEWQPAVRQDVKWSFEGRSSAVDLLKPL
jgi:hypothetical protein